MVVEEQTDPVHNPQSRMYILRITLTVLFILVTPCITRAQFESTYDNGDEDHLHAEGQGHPGTENHPVRGRHADDSVERAADSSEISISNEKSQQTSADEDQGGSRGDSTGHTTIARYVQTDGV
ncbi:unnamed protein product [Gongylonema pulchrum]|uniref:Secreted protein n=1 Tax=Gongylonema pulchrum TaxID=637853 RepID=A0A183DP62_9BILA|nr:unnamed protein product [Gongylonema pulchrum]